MYFEINFFFVSIVYFLENESLKVEAWDVALNWGGGRLTMHIQFQKWTLTFTLKLYH